MSKAATTTKFSYHSSAGGPGSRAGTMGARRLRPLRSHRLAEISEPPRACLSPEDQTRACIRAQRAQRRLERLLPRTSGGYQQFVDHIHEAIENNTFPYKWLPLKDRFKGDLVRIKSAFAGAEALAEKTLGDRGETQEKQEEQEARAIRALDEGVKVLHAYAVDPETSFQWAKNVLSSGENTRATGGLRRSRRARQLLARCVEAVSKERGRLVSANLRLVLKDALHFCPVGMEYEDLYQEGIIGLHKAVMRFDTTRGIRFTTYATYWIRQAIGKALTERSRLIRVPKTIQEKIRQPRPAMQTDEIERVKRLLWGTVLFSCRAARHEDASYFFDVRDESQPNRAGEGAFGGEILGAVNEALRRLTPRDQDVVMRRFGLCGRLQETFESIGNRMHLSRESIRQIEIRALKQLKHCREMRSVHEDSVS